eukprot:765559-Pyramimonas_sp.AAC.1
MVNDLTEAVALVGQVPDTLESRLKLDGERLDHSPGAGLRLECGPPVPGLKTCQVQLQIL